MGLDPNDEALNRKIHNESYHYGDILGKNISINLIYSKILNCMHAYKYP